MNGIMSFLKETTKGTSLISAVNTQTYYFGAYNETNKGVESPTLENEIKKSWTYSSRKPSLSYGVQKIPNLKVKVNPFNCIPYFHFLGKSTEAVPCVLEVEETAEKDSFSIHDQHPDGITHVRELLGGQAAAIAGNIEINKDEELEIIYVGTELVDEDTAQTLTTAPIAPETKGTIFHGKPLTTFDPDGTPVIHNEIVKIGYSQNQNITTNHSSSTKENKFHEFNPVELDLVGVCQTDDMWEYMRDQGTVDIAVRTFKSNRTYYKDLIFEDVKFMKPTVLGNIFETEYLTTMKAQAQSIKVNFITEFTTFATWF